MHGKRFSARIGVPLGGLLTLAVGCGDGESALAERDGGTRSGLDAGRGSGPGPNADPTPPATQAADAGGRSQLDTASDAGAPVCEGLSARVLAEELVDTDAALSDLTFNGNVAAFVDAALARRYPFGLELVRGGRRDTSFGDCSVVFAEPAESAADVYSSMEVIVHECGHIHDSFLSSGNRNVYELNAERRYQCDRGDTTSRGGDTFARSRIGSDAFEALRPPCAGNRSAGCDPYADIYLDGNPDDGVFESGDQGFNLLMEEAVQYVHSLATAWAFEDRQPQFIAVSARDGILTFLWYVERYLRLARTQYPSAYARIANDQCWRELTLSVWTRARRYLELTRAEITLGIEDEDIEELVNDPVLLAEIERLRALQGCP
ncbi:MAG: hypothetical protein ABI895_38780 [Deltaproteobacteria bacterium]